MNETKIAPPFRSQNDLAYILELRKILAKSHGASLRTKSRKKSAFVVMKKAVKKMSTLFAHFYQGAKVIELGLKKMN